jgi:hypothetical protein
MSHQERYKSPVVYVFADIRWSECLLKASFLKKNIDLLQTRRKALDSMNIRLKT